MKSLFNFSLKFLAEHFLVLSSNRQMYVWNHAIFKRMTQKCCLSDTAAAGNDNKLRFFSRIFPHSAKHLDFFCSADKLHLALLKTIVLKMSVLKTVVFSHNRLRLSTPYVKHVYPDFLGVNVDTSSRLHAIFGM